MSTHPSPLPKQTLPSKQTLSSRTPPAAGEESPRRQLSAREKLAKRLGQLLVERGEITGEQLIRAIQSQRSVGGRIGTCLLEMDVLDEDHLLEALSDQLQVPPARVEELRGVTDEVLHLVPSKLALKCRAIPFFATDKKIKVATLDVRNLGFLDELAFCTNRRVEPHIANEARIFEALEKYYGYECPRRYGYLLDRLNRSRYLWDESAKLLFKEDGAAEVVWSEPDEAFGGDDRKLPRPVAGRSSRSGSRQAPSRTPAAGADRTQAAPALTPSWGSATAMSLDDVDHLLDHDADPHLVGEIVLRFMAPSFLRSAIFKVQKDKVQGWMARGEGFDHLLFRSLQLRLNQPSAFLELEQQGAGSFRGPLAPLPAHRQMARSWGGRLPKECLMVPVRIRGRLACVLYGDRGPEGLAGIDEETFRQLAAKAATALERHILRKKRELERRLNQEDDS